MARKPNYRFERNERDRLKAAKKAKRLADKKAARGEEVDQSDLVAENDGPGADATETPSGSSN